MKVWIVVLKVFGAGSRALCVHNGRTLAGRNVRSKGGKVTEYFTVYLWLEDSSAGIAALRFVNFLLNAFVNRVRRRKLILSVRLCRSTNEVLIWSGSGLPTMGVLMAATKGPGE